MTLVNENIKMEMKANHTHNKRSQIQMGESVAIVIIVVILLIVGIVFWSNIKGLDIKQMDESSQQLSVVELAKIVSELPELRCYNTNTVSKINCFDYYKLLAFNKTVNDPTSAVFLDARRMYGNYFKNSKITFRQIYPEEMNITIYDENVTSQTTLKITIPVIIERRLDRTGINTFGMIVVEGYYK